MKKLKNEAQLAKMALAIGCVDLDSTANSKDINSCSEIELKILISLILKTPLVTVPVLSITTVFTLVIASRKDAPLNRIPLRDAAPNPPK